MKKTVSQIYRLAFILFCIWAAVEGLFLSPGGYAAALGDIAFLADTLCFPVMLAAFIFSLTGRTPGAVQKMKGAVTAIALLVLVLYFSIFFTPSASGWILKILLPGMVALDYILFDKKGAFRLWDILFWFLAWALLYALWSLLNGHGFSLSDFMDFFGGADRFLTTLLTTLLAGALMLGLDKLFSGKAGLKPWNLFCWIYRIIFLLLTGWALYNTGRETLHTFFLQLNRFAVLSAFLCFLAIAVVLIFCILHTGKASAASPFPRIKGAFTLLAAVTCIGHHFFIGGTTNNAVQIILYYVCPIMMIFDWILFDSKGKFRPYDPLWWAAVPMLYCVVFLVQKSFFVLYPTLALYQTETFFCGGILGLLAVAYGIYLIDFALNHR